MGNLRYGICSAPLDPNWTGRTQPIPDRVVVSSSNGSGTAWEAGRQHNLCAKTGWVLTELQELSVVRVAPLDTAQVLWRGLVHYLDWFTVKFAYWIWFLVHEAPGVVHG